MEALGAVSSIITLLELSKKAYGFIDKVARAPEERQTLSRELKDVREVLIALKECVDRNPQSEVLQRLDDPEGAIKNLTKLLSDLTGGEKLEGFCRFRWPFKKGEVLGYIMEIERHKRNFTIAIATTNLAITKGMDDTVRKIHATQCSQEQAENSYHTETKRERILNWLYPAQFDTKHIEIQNKRQENTGEWFLNAPEFKGWEKEQPDCYLLHGHGIPGAGKTVLSSLVVDHFEDRAKTENIGVAYIYFDYGEQDQQKDVHILACLVKQLACKIPGVPQEIENIHTRLNDQQKTLTLKDLEPLLLSIAKRFARVFLILDALDECHPEYGRKKLLPSFKKMAANGISLFLTSRPYPEDIQLALGRASSIKILAAEKDIETYIAKELDENPRAQNLLQDKRLKDRIICVLKTHAKGMFLFVHLFISYLCKRTFAEQVSNDLDDLESGCNKSRLLESMYEEAMDLVRGRDGDDRDLAVKIFSWLTKSRRALTVDEIRVAVAVKPGKYQLEEAALPDKATLLSVCAGLVTIDESTNMIRLIHLTAHEYLMKQPMIMENADFNLTMACITYLTFDAFRFPVHSKKLLSEQLLSYPLLDYAIHHHRFHLGNCDEDLTADMFFKFATSSGNIASFREHALPRHNSSKLTPERDISIGVSARYTYPLHIAVSAGHITVVQRLLKVETNIDILDCRETPLQTASIYGYSRLAEILLENGANPSAVYKLDRKRTYDANYASATPLQIAAYKGHEELVRILLENGADVLAQSILVDSALHFAARRGHGGIINLLLGKGADISATDYGCHRSTPLHIAAECGQETAFRLLLERSAGIPHANNYGMTILLAIIAGSSSCQDRCIWLPMIELLLERWPEILAQMKEESMVLYYAVRSENGELCRLLINKGAKVSPLYTGDSGTALHMAAESAQEDICRLLLEKGLDISTPDNHGRTALHSAAGSGHENICQLLLENGLNVFVSDENGQTPLQEAALAGEDRVFKLLLEKGADRWILDKHGQTLLHLAATGPRASLALIAPRCYLKEKKEQANRKQVIVWWLLKMNFDIAALDKEGQTALHKAASAGYEGLVRVLLENDADSSIMDQDGKTALHEALIRGHTAIAKLLLETGANLTHDKYEAIIIERAIRSHNTDMVDLLSDNNVDFLIGFEDGKTALHIAQRPKILQTLLKKGANVSLRDNRGETALYQAAIFGYTEAISLLLQNGADISVVNNDEQTVLHLVSMRFRPTGTWWDGMNLSRWEEEDGTHLLLDRGVSFSAIDKHGMTALDYACYYHHDNLVKLLVHHAISHNIPLPEQNPVEHQKNYTVDPDTSEPSPPSYIINQQTTEIQESCLYYLAFPVPPYPHYLSSNPIFLLALLVTLILIFMFPALFAVGRAFIPRFIST